MFTQTCPECKREFKHENEAVSKRMLGVHRNHAHGYNSKTDYKRKSRAKATPRHIAALEKARAARWGDHKPRTREETNERARLRYHEKKAERMAEKVVDIAQSSIAQQRKEEASHRDRLQRSAWWGAENKQTVTCPCCAAEFIIVSGSKH